MRTRQVRPEKLDFEYELHLTREYDSTKKVDFILFDFRTKKLFENFIYDINIIPEIDADKRVMQFDIEGLSAPKVDISKSGYANYQYMFYDFKNAEYTLNLLKYGKGKIVFKFKVTPKTVKLTSEPKKKFINIITKN